MSERMHFSVKLGKQGQGDRPGKPAKGFTVIMLGTFGGGTGTGNPLNEGVASLHPVDIDTLDALIAKLQPSLTIGERDDHSISLSFNSLDDFHPDGLLEQLGGYRLSTPVVTTDAPSESAQEATGLSGTSEASDESESAQATLSRLLGERPLTVEKQQQTGSTITSAKKAMIENVVRRIAENATEHSESLTVESSSPDGLQSDDRADSLRSLLHLEAFQQLEACWRSVDWLLHSTEADPAVRFYILNMPRDLLHQQRSDHPDPKSSPLCRLLNERIERDTASESDFILIDNHCYGPDHGQIAMLEWLGSLVDRYDGTLLAGADSSLLVGDASAEDHLTAWQAFRTRPMATRISLLYPEVLLRLPYGPSTDPVQSFSFEELEESWSIDELLWGNPAYAALILQINQRMNEGAGEQPSLLTELPAYSYQSEGERHLQPCARHLLSERQIERLLKLGLVPVVGSRNRNVIQIPWYQHLALPIDP
ncbi:MAG: type VI secretion system contractile sheath large subunit [Candidatus Thiodiazotropha sp.]